MVACYCWHLLGLLFDPEIVGVKSLSNVGFSPDYMALYLIVKAVRN
jgi:hypothetical protein